LHEDRARAARIAEEVIAAFPAIFQRYHIAGMRSKLGLYTEEDGDVAPMTDLLTCLHRCNLDYTVTFRSLDADMAADAPLFNDAKCTAWYRRWKERLARQPQSIEDSSRLTDEHETATLEGTAQPAIGADNPRRCAERPLAALLAVGACSSMARSADE
jgi:uncharacterized protein YdiU (UPF0061 family)